MRGLPSAPNPRLHHLRLPEGVPAPSLWYRSLRRLCHVGVSAMWKIRVFDRRHEPTRGGAVYISNHQSFLDPVLMGVGLRRPVNYMARHSLFRVPVFRQLIGSLNAFPVHRGTADRGALKEAMRRIEAGGQVGVRGPLGNWFPFEDVAGKQILFIGGGIGLFPLRPQIQDVYRERERFASVTVLYGARTPEDLVYTDELERWQQQEGMTCLLTVDTASDGWTGNVGVVGSLLDFKI